MLLPALVQIGNAAALADLQAGHRLQEFLLAASGNTGNAQDLPGIRGEGDVVEPLDAVRASHRQPLDHDPGLRIHGIGPLDIERDRAADHHIGHFLRVGVLRHHVPDVLAVAQDRHAVGEFLHLVHLMGNDDDRLAVLPHFPKDSEQLLRLLRRQDRRRLVEDQDIRPAVEDLDDLHRLFLGHGHLVDLLIRIHVEAVGAADLADLLRGRGDIQLSGQAENDIFRGAQDVHQLEMLMDHADPVAEGLTGRGDGHLLLPDEDLPLIREIDPGEHVHQRGLAAAVLSEKRKDLALIDIEIHL